MLRDKRHVFWQALLVTALIFSLGIVFGIYIEQIRADESNILFINSESSLFDTIALISYLDNENISCKELISSQIIFADKIYGEAKLLEEYDESSKITDSLKAVHKKYDLLRTILWINSIKVKEKCSGFNIVVYLYEYNSDDISVKSKQGIWSKVLADLKGIEGNKLILIPIAVDNDVTTLSIMLNHYNIKEYTVVIINEEIVITDVSPAEELEKYLE